MEEKVFTEQELTKVVCKLLTGNQVYQKKIYWKLDGS